MTRKLIIIALLFIMQALVFFIAGFWGPPLQSFEPVEVNIPPRVSARHIGTVLARNKIVPTSLHFLVVAKFQGMARNLNPGRFHFHRAQPVWEVVETIATTKPNVFWITIPEGYTLNQVASVIEKKTKIHAEETIALAEDKDFISSLNIQADSLEGYLFPDTYQLDVEWSNRQILKEMVRRFKEIWGFLNGRWDPEESIEIRSLTVTPGEIITMASIIEREGLHTSEYNRIASVFYNRLAEDMKLQSCATVRYALNDWKSVLTNKHLRVDSLYNTYKHKCLPPGPICSPGRVAIQAALNPDDRDEFYFVARHDGWHDFSITHKEHVKAKSNNR